MTTEITRPTIATPVQFQDPLPDKVDVAIIGAGVIGVFSALYMARRGLKVLLCEKGRVAGEQSSRKLGLDPSAGPRLGGTAHHDEGPHALA